MRVPLPASDGADLLSASARPVPGGLMRGSTKTAGACCPYSRSERVGLLGVGVQSISLKDHMNLVKPWSSGTFSVGM